MNTLPVASMKVTNSKITTMIPEDENDCVGNRKHEIKNDEYEYHQKTWQRDGDPIVPVAAAPPQKSFYEDLLQYGSENSNSTDASSQQRRRLRRQNQQQRQQQQQVQHEHFPGQHQRQLQQQQQQQEQIRNTSRLDSDNYYEFKQHAQQSPFEEARTIGMMYDQKFPPQLKSKDNYESKASSVGTKSENYHRNTSPNFLPNAHKHRYQQNTSNNDEGALTRTENDYYHPEDGGIASTATTPRVTGEVARYDPNSYNQRQQQQQQQQQQHLLDLMANPGVTYVNEPAIQPSSLMYQTTYGDTNANIISTPDIRTSHPRTGNTINSAAAALAAASGNMTPRSASIARISNNQTYPQYQRPNLQRQYDHNIATSMHQHMMNTGTEEHVKSSIAPTRPNRLVPPTATDECDQPVHSKKTHKFGVRAISGMFRRNHQHNTAFTTSQEKKSLPELELESADYLAHDASTNSKNPDASHPLPFPHVQLQQRQEQHHIYPQQKSKPSYTQNMNHQSGMNHPHLNQYSSAQINEIYEEERNQFLHIQDHDYYAMLASLQRRDRYNNHSNDYAMEPPRFAGGIMGTDEPSAITEPSAWTQSSSHDGSSVVTDDSLRLALEISRQEQAIERRRQGILRQQQSFARSKGKRKVSAEKSKGTSSSFAQTALERALAGQEHFEKSNFEEEDEHVLNTPFESLSSSVMEHMELQTKIMATQTSFSKDAIYALTDICDRTIEEGEESEEESEEDSVSSVNDVLLALKLSTQDDAQVSAGGDQFSVDEWTAHTQSQPTNNVQAVGITSSSNASQNIRSTSNSTISLSLSENVSESNDDEEQRRLLDQILEEQEQRELEMALKASEQDINHHNLNDGSMHENHHQLRMGNHIIDQAHQTEASSAATNTTTTPMIGASSRSHLYGRTSSNNSTEAETRRQEVLKRGASETRQAVQRGEALVTVCLGCEGRLQAPIGYSLVYCPQCETISPVQSS